MPQIARKSYSSIALDGGVPVRERLLPYAKQRVEEEDIDLVVEVLRSDWLTTGPRVQEFEEAFATQAGTLHAVALNSGTAALHLALCAAGIKTGDEVIVPAMTFAASANAALYLGAKPVFADIEPDTLLVDPKHVGRLLNPKTRAIVAVDYAGQPCNYKELRSLAASAGIPLIADACHSLGGSFAGEPVGSLADATCFSFHPVKHITTGEGGMVATSRPDLAAALRTLRNHGISQDHRQREQNGTFDYEMEALGYNYRLSDLNCALGFSQLQKLAEWNKERRRIALRYDELLKNVGGVQPLARRSDRVHAHHLYVVQLDLAALSVDRNTVFKALRAEGIGANVHYKPVYLHKYYATELKYQKGQCPKAEAAYNSVLTLPLYVGMTNNDQDDVLDALAKVLAHFQR